MKALALFLVAVLVLFAGAGALLGTVFPGEAARGAVWVSAGIALVVQLLAFAIMRLTRGDNFLAGWGLGVLLRMLTLAVYALVVAKAVGLPLAPALVSLAAFFFVSTLIEPLLLKL